MELDEMRQAWREVDRKLQKLRFANENLRIEMHACRARQSMWRTELLMWIEAIANGLGLLLLGVFIAQQSALRFILPAALLYPAAVAIFASSVAQLVLLSRIDYGAPVLDIQRQLESLRLLRLRTTQGELLSALLLWVPLAVVLMRALKGIDLYALGAGWIAVNVALGAAAIPLLWWLAKRFGPLFNRSRFGRILLDDLAGRGLAEARGQMAATARFAAE